MRVTIFALAFLAAAPAWAASGGYQCGQDLAETRAELYAKAPALTPQQERAYAEKLDLAESYCGANLNYPSSAIFGDLFRLRRELQSLDTATARLPTPSTPYPMD